MPLLSFSVFKDKILSGAKRHTIRAPRKIPITVGDKLYMWWKSRSPEEKEKLGEAKCINTNPIEIDDDCVHILDTSNFYNTTTYSSKEALDRFAVSDGFDSWDEMRDFFDKTHGLPFTGDLIEWDSIKSAF
jgi:hypothetical protein